VSAKRGATDLSGILIVDKPGCMTSHDVVDRIRRITGERRVGHAGTLDPMATGVLAVLIGPATRLAPYLSAAEKTYEARIAFGAETDTDDAEGRITATAGIPDEVCDPFAAAAFVASLVGSHDQVPPAFSAIKRGGVTSYQAARKGEALELEARTIEVAGARLTGVEVEPPAWDVEFTVSKGTYIRALARDLGRALGTAAHLGALRRVRSGYLTLEHASTLDALDEAARIEQDGASVESLFADPVEALGLPVIALDDAQMAAVKDGRALEGGFPGVADGAPVALSHGGRLVALYATAGSSARPLVVIPGGVGGGGS
jgi:tRNA pseudouridine55 synthase